MKNRLYMCVYAGVFQLLLLSIHRGPYPVRHNTAGLGVVLYPTSQVIIIVMITVPILTVIAIITVVNSCQAKEKFLSSRMEAVSTYYY